jgi:hypothetical protein
MLSEKDLWSEQAQGYSANSPSRESGYAYGQECFGVLARPNADLERDDGLVPPAG